MAAASSTPRVPGSALPLFAVVPPGVNTIRQPPFRRRLASLLPPPSTAGSPVVISSSPGCRPAVDPHHPGRPISIMSVGVEVRSPWRQKYALV